MAQHQAQHMASSWRRMAQHMHRIRINGADTCGNLTACREQFPTRRYLKHITVATNNVCLPRCLVRKHRALLPEYRWSSLHTATPPTLLAQHMTCVSRGALCRNIWLFAGIQGGFPTHRHLTRITVSPAFPCACAL